MAREMGYSADPHAPGVVMGRTQTIDVAVTTITDRFVAELLQAIETTAHSRGYLVILSSSQSEPEREIAAVEMLRSKQVDVGIVASSRRGVLYQAHLDQVGLPVILINSHREQPSQLDTACRTRWGLSASPANEPMARSW